MIRPLTEDERALMWHITRWGSDGYPIRKLRSKWTWGPWRSVEGPPVVFPTKRAAVASFEAFLDVIREAYGEERYAAATADSIAEMYRTALEDGDQALAMLCVTALSKSATPARRDARAACIVTLRDHMATRAGYQ